ncbi:hypothetical protein FFLO_04123 [Filobasidium floriforme]|uniref:Uncharacterized protein n=1 Tax=Filobasidium floriforme TaxID=5210 RepID=A0A8K0NQ73_9TREE|nr:uncharacterized protein HD553DRAFT_321858 [Filobasidium floriforme]KAG7531754.1 hypothetical protein FFLO_04123 [Filobasidium floriforme]KAH8089813.1 hypothetical protein HD553DRAFT_321858 [Filobasidium floriforme]
MPQFPSISVPQLYSSLLTAARSIPRDPLRPSLQLPETLETLVQRAFKRPIPTVGASNAESSAIKELSQEEVTKLGFGIGDLTRLDRSLKAMQEINQDTAFRKYPLSARTLSPPTDPLYYTRLVQGVERAGQGKARNWWKVFFQSKGQA